MVILTKAESATIKSVGRIRSVDILRGAIMVLMAIDHVRVYSGIPAGGPAPGIFFTRWVTHFSAPGFAFLAGTSAFLYSLRLSDNKKLARFLFSRGLLLVFLELTLIRFFWTFNFNYRAFTLAGVIWMLGWCMVILSAFVRLRPTTIGIIGLIIIFGQQIFHVIPGIFPTAISQPVGWIWNFFYPADLPGAPGIAILYVLIPWIGVMMAGYGFGQILIMEAATRKRISLRIGITAILAYLVVGVLLIKFGPAYEGKLNPFFRLLNQQKYPASQLFLMMTLGPLIALLPLAEKSTGWFATILETIGRVPMFYYLLHILLIHVSAIIANLILSGSAHQEWYGSAPFVEVDEGRRWSLGVLYLVYFIDLVILYFACSWYGKFKFSHREIRWLKYV
jgi:uncharacterized membrane protein